MSKHSKPWTFEDYELHHQDTWEVYDPNLARLVAVFYNEDDALEYLKWRNKKQAKRKGKELRKGYDEDARWAWPS
jgi:hypothetical protein